MPDERWKNGLTPEQIKAVEEAEKISSQRETQQTEESTEMSYPASFGAGFMQGLTNIPRGIAQIQNESYPTPEILQEIPAEFNQLSRDLYNKSYNQNMLTTLSGELAGDVTGGIAALLAGRRGGVTPQALRAGLAESKMAPYLETAYGMAKKIPNILKAPAKGAVAGGTGAYLSPVEEGDTRLGNVESGALVGGVLGSGFSALGGLAKKGAEIAEPYIDKLKMTEMGRFINEFPKEINKWMSQTEEGMRSKASGHYKNANEAAEGLDLMSKEIEDAHLTGQISDEEFNDLNIGYKPDDYHKALQAEINRRLKDTEKNPSNEKMNAKVINKLEKFKLNEVNNWVDAVNQRKVLNQEYGKIKGKTHENEYKKAINYAISSLMKNTEKNLEGKNIKFFEDNWRAANETYKEMENVFGETVSSTGRKTSSTPFRNFKTEEEGTYPDINLVKSMLPKDSSEELGQLSKLEKMVGSKERAADIYRGNEFRGVFEDGKLDYEAFFNKFKTLSQSQKEYMFDAEQLQKMKKAYSSYKDHPNTFRNKPEALSIENILRQTPGGLPWLGGFAGTAFGLPGSIVGAGAGALAKNLLQGKGERIASKYMGAYENENLRKLYSRISEILPMASGQMSASGGNKNREQ